MVNFKKLMKSCVSMMTAVTMIAGMAAMMPGAVEVHAASVVTVDLSKSHQMIRGFGGINHPEWTGADLSSSQRQTAFGNGKNQLGMTVLRVFVNPDKNQWYKAVDTAKYAQSQGAVIFASPWEPPSNLAEKGSGGIRGGKLHLPKRNYAAYAQHLNDFCSYMKSKGVQIYSISVQNEPDYAGEWTAWSSDETTDFLANYADKITSARVMSPETFQYTNKDYYTKILNNSKAMANCDLFGTHFYGTQRSQMDFAALESCGKEIWMTEVYVPNSNANSADNWPEAISVAENIHNGLVVGNMSAYVWWYIRRSYSPMKEDGNISKRGYCMAHYSKWVRPGYVRVNATEQPANNVLVSAYKGDKNKVVIVAVNKSTTGYAQEFSISGKTIADVDRYRTTQGENIAETQNLETNGGNFFAQLPAQSVSTFVITLTSDHGTSSGNTNPTPTPPAVINPDQNGYYYHDKFEDNLCDWEARGEVKLQLSGRAPYNGTNAVVVTDRTSAWNGMQKSLPVSTFKPGQKFCFSACVNFLDADVNTEKLSLTLQYKNSSGETKYANIDTKTCTKENYVQLYNPSYQIPSDATEMQLVIETANGTMNFYADEVIVAKEGVSINGPAEVTTVVTTVTTPAPTTTTTKPVTTVTTTTSATPATQAPAGPVKGDADANGSVTASDLVRVIQHLVGKTTLSDTGVKNADMNSDGRVSILDLIMLKNSLV